MTSTLCTIRTPGLSTIQDGGRRGFTEVGVPVSGAFHRVRYLVATALLSGSADDHRPSIEVLGGELTLDVAATTVMAVVGPAALTVDGRREAGGTAVSVPAGATVVVAHAGPGPAYLVVDGWMPGLTLGSASIDTFSGIGGGPLRPGAVLPGSPTAAGRRRVGSFHRALIEPTGPLGVGAAGHPSLRAFVSAAWSVTSIARSGARLVGGPIPSSGSVPSMPTIPGAVQVTPSGEVLVLGPDGGLTGGYPVVAVVVSAELDRLSLLLPGEPIAFRAVEIDEAVAARRAQLAMVRRAVAHPDQLP